MAQDHGKSIEEEFIKRALAGFGELSAGVYRELGPATGTEQFSNNQQVALATYTPYPDPVKRQQYAMQMFQQGATLEQVTDEIYPRLRPLVELAGTGVRDRITYAKHLRNIIDKRIPTMQQQISDAESSSEDMLPTEEQEPVDPLFDTETPKQTLHPILSDYPSATYDTTTTSSQPEPLPTPPTNSISLGNSGPVQAVPPMNLLGG